MNVVAWLPDVEDADLDPEMAKMAEAQIKSFGFVLNPFRQSARIPAVASGAAAMSRGIGRSGKTSERISHLLNLRVAAIVGCPF